MKIDIHITDATPEEAALVFTGVTVGQAVGRVAAKVAEKHVAKEIERVKKPVPDPQPGQTGCEGCLNTEFDAAKCEECSPTPTPEPAKRPKATVKGKPGPVPGSGKGNSFGIPVLLYTTDKKQYQRLWSRCKTKGIKYEQALAMEGKTKLVGRHAKKMGREPLATTPAKEPPRCKDGNLPAKAIKDKIKAATVAIAASKEPVLVPVTMDKAPACEIVAGLHVRQMRPDGGRKIFGTGLVLARHGEIVEVRNGGGKVHKILAACLEVVPSGGASDRATGASS